MKIERQVIQNNQVPIPSAVIIPEHSLGAAVVIHGYGGCKEEQIGLAWRVAEIGITSITIDLRGHGEQAIPFDAGIVADLEATIEYAKQFGRVTTIGHSLGGRLALLSKSDYTIAISPALNQEFGVTTHKILENVRGYRVKEKSTNEVFEILRELPIWNPGKDKKTLILYGTRDVPEIIQACLGLQATGVPVMEIAKAVHSDTFLLEATFSQILTQLREWYR